MFTIIFRKKKKKLNPKLFVSNASLVFNKYHPSILSTVILKGALDLTTRFSGYFVVQSKSINLETSVHFLSCYCLLCIFIYDDLPFEYLGIWIKYLLLHNQHRDLIARLFLQM